MLLVCCVMFAPREHINQAAVQHHVLSAPLDRIALPTGHQFLSCVLQDHTTLWQAAPQKMLAFCVELGNFKTAPAKRIVTHVLQGRIASTMDLLWRRLVMLVRATPATLLQIVFSALLDSSSLE